MGIKTVTPAIVEAARDVVNKTRLVDLELASKSEEENVGNKISCKGVNRRTNHYSPYDFILCLRDERPVSGVNFSFTYRNGKLYRTRLHKNGLNASYWKRKVKPNGYETEMLDEPKPDPDHKCDACFDPYKNPQWL